MARLLPLLLLALELVSCRSTGSKSQVLEQSESRDYQAFEKAWSDYVAGLKSQHPYELQPRCQPLLTKPKGQIKGVVLLFHGFTACPMQFLPFAERLSELGYYSMIPLLPGQGRAPTPLHGDMKLKEDGKDVSYAHYYARYLPTKADVYQEFVSRFNAMIALAPGEHAVAGLSVGGALATQAVLIAKKQGFANLYQRSLAISPYYGMPGLYLGRQKADNIAEAILHVIERPVGDLIYHVQKGLAAGSEKIGLLGEIPLTFGKGCYASICGDRSQECANAHKNLQVKGGRDAICDFKIANIEALERNGQAIIRDYKTMVNQGELKTKHQTIGVSFDGSANVSLTEELGELASKKAANWSNYCFYSSYKGQKIGHVIFDLTEVPFAPMPWRQSFMDQAILFLDEGKFFQSTLESGVPACAIFAG